MPKYFDLFPVIPYDISGAQRTNYELVRNIFFRVRVVRDVINNISAYYEYVVKAGDTPEILADKFYGDPEAHWIIMMANDIIDVAYDWPLDYNEFNKYIYKKYYYSADKSKLKEIIIVNPGSGYSNGYIVFSGGNGISTNARIFVNATGSIVRTSVINYGSKYLASDNVSANVSHLGGSNANLSVILTEPTLSDVISWTQDTTNPNSIHHYEKVIQRTESLSATTTETRFVINAEPYSNTAYYITNPDDVRIVLSGINGTFETGNIVNSAGNTFVGRVNVYESSNGYIAFDNAAGYIVYNQNLMVRSNTQCNANVSIVYSPLRGSLVQDSSIPYFTYEDLAEVQYVQTFNMGYVNKNTTNTLVDAGRTVYQVSFRDKISIYEYEDQMNEAKRTIKIIKPEYYPKIIEEFNNFTNYASSPYLRKLIV